MKTLIISFGIIIMSIMGMAYQSDLSNYYFLEQHLQSLTEECVAYAALSCYDEESGIIEFNESICQVKVDELISYASTHMACFRDGSLKTGNIIFSEGENPKISLELTFIPNYSLFRQKNIKTPDLTHESCYEWVLDTSEN